MSSTAGWIYLSIAKTSSRSSRPSGSASDVRPSSTQPERRYSAMAACDDSTTSSTGTRCCVTAADRAVCSSARADTPAADVGIDEQPGDGTEGTDDAGVVQNLHRSGRRLCVEGNVATDVVRPTRTPRPRGVRARQEPVVVVAGQVGGIVVGRTDARHNLCEGVEVNVGTPSNNHHAGQCADSRLTPKRRSRRRWPHGTTPGRCPRTTRDNAAGRYPRTPLPALSNVPRRHSVGGASRRACVERHQIGREHCAPSCPSLSTPPAHRSPSRSSRQSGRGQSHGATWARRVSDPRPCAPRSPTETVRAQIDAIRTDAVGRVRESRGITRSPTPSNAGSMAAARPPMIAPTGGSRDASTSGGVSCQRGR